VDALAATVPSGSWPLFDGYRSAPAATTTAARAYRAAILLRGFSEDDIVEHTPEIEAQKTDAEAATTAKMAALFAPLSPTQLEAIVAGTNALAAAVG
jgi:hypothetical protein